MRCALALLALSALAVRAAADETPVVREVRLETDAPTRARLSRYLKQGPGEPLDLGAVAESVRLLYATGEFADVVVETEPAPPGVDVVFRPLPAPRMAALKVVGDHVLSEKETRRVTRLRPHEPLWQARLEEAARDAALWLAARGYLEARVSARVELEPNGATAVFEVASGPLVIVESVALEGEPPEMAGALRPRAEPRAGQAFERARAEKARETLTRELQARQHWRASVALREAYDPKRARVKLAFEVEAGPLIEVSVRGSKLPTELRRMAERIVREGHAQDDALEEALDRIDQGLRERGYRNPNVKRSEESGAAGLTIVYQVNAGELAEVASVRIVGAEAIPLEVLLTTRAAAPLRDDVLERDVAELLRALREQGFGEAQVESEAGEGGGPQAVVFRVRPGQRHIVGEVRVVAPDLPGPKQTQLLTRSGDPQRIRTLALDKAALLAAWRESGYPLVEVEPEVALREDKARVDVTFRVEPGPRTLFGEIVVAGLRRTRERVVRRSLGFAEGDPFSLARLLEAQRSLQALGIFERVEARPLLGAAAVRPTVVALEEAPRAAIAYGLGYAERDLLRGSVEVTLRNLYGTERSLTSFARISFRGSRLVATYREPRLFSRRQELFVTAFREEQDRDSFDFVRYGGLMQTARSLAPKLTLIGRLTYQRTEVFNVTVPLDEIDRQFRSSTFAGPSASLIFDTRNDPLDPRRGHFLGADIELSQRFLGGDAFVKGFLQVASYAPLGPRLVVALSGRVGLGRTFGNEPPRLPLPDRFFAGGDYSLRGFAVDAVNLEGGNGLLIGATELRFAASRRIEVAAFSDVGNVYPLASGLSLGDLRYTAGLGLRYKSSIGPLRIDWGYKLNRRPGERPYQIHVTVGHAF